MTTNYNRGAAFERRVRDDLCKRGYWAQRSPKSGGVVDVFAYHMGIALFSQCKRNGIRSMTREEARALLALAKRHNALALFVEPAKLHGKRRTGIVYWLNGKERFEPPRLTQPLNTRQALQ